MKTWTYWWIILMGTFGLDHISSTKVLHRLESRRAAWEIMDSVVPFFLCKA
jgi:hypothetical protein